VDGLKANNLGKEFHFFTCLCDRTFLDVGSDWKASAHAIAERTIRILPNMFSPFWLSLTVKISVVAGLS
jgi:hypothetical protein